MIVQILTTGEEHFVWLVNAVADYQKEHDIRIQTQPADVILGTYDIGISFMHQHKVPAKEVNTHTWFNFHPAPLPEYRGRDLCYHAIMSGATEFGTTFHYMDENFDTGCIIDCFKFKILDTDNAESLSEFAIKQCKGQFKSYFPEIIAGKKFECTPNVGGTYFKKGNILAEVPIHPADPFGLWVRAVTYKDFAPRIDIGGVKYKIVRDE